MTCPELMPKTLKKIKGCLEQIGEEVQKCWRTLKDLSHNFFEKFSIELPKIFSKNKSWNKKLEVEEPEKQPKAFRKEFTKKLMEEFPTIFFNKMTWNLI